MTKRDSLASTIDGATGFPLHRQVGAVLRNQIANGEYRVGDQLPTEGALGDQFGVSRATIRMALRALEAEGLLTRRRALSRGARPSPERTRSLADGGGSSTSAGAVALSAMAELPP